MTLLDRYIGRTVALTVAGALAVLMALTAVVELVAQLRQLGAGYGLPDALRQVLLTLPAQAVQLFPIALLLGALLGLGALGQRSELVVVRAAGVSVVRIALSVMVAAVPLTLLAAAVGEWVAPEMARLARAARANAESVGIRHSRFGFWARVGSDFVHVERILPGGRLAGVTVYQLEGRRLRGVLTARLAVYEDGRWRLEAVRWSRFGAEGVEAGEGRGGEAQALLDPETTRLLATPPGELSVRELLRYRAYLVANGLDPRRYEAALWAKLLAPMSNLLIVALALPFVFGPLRSVGAGSRMVVGIFIGIAVHVGARLSEQAGQALGWPPVLGAALPTLLLAAVVAVTLARVR